MKNFKIGDKLTRFPLIQGGMGVGISLGRLAGTVAKEGGIGIISTAQIGYREKDFDRNTEEANQRAILSEMKKARRISPDGIIGYNIMVALKEYASHVKAAVHAGADLIISGAGLPTELPALVSGSKTKIAPIVSTDKSAKVILKYWERKYKRTADLVVIEGPQAGGHLGFHKEELDSYTPEAYDNEIRKIVQTALDRNRKKLSLQQKQMKDTEKKDKYKVYGELINTYGYGLEEGCKSFKAVNYYNGEEITIPLDPTLTPQENSKKYFDRYGKLKRTQEALEVQIADTTSEIEHLESISNALDIAAEESDLSQIKEELMEYGYVKRHYGNKKGAKMQVKSKPFHYVSSDGYDIYVGKNNYQNDELTFKFATGNDWWFHAKKMPGSHVVVKTKDGTLPDRTFEEAGNLAAFYSKGRTAPKVEIDYLQKKNVKKPAGAKPGFVVYYTNYSLMASPDIAGIQQLS